LFSKIFIASYFPFGLENSHPDAQTREKTKEVYFEPQIKIISFAFVWKILCLSLVYKLENISKIGFMQKLRQPPAYFFAGNHLKITCGTESRVPSLW
jgi:hypothetical protein